MNADRLEQIIEALLFTSEKPLDVKKLLLCFSPEDDVTVADLEAGLCALEKRYASRAVQLSSSASGYRFVVGEGFSPWLSRVWAEKPQKYSRAFLETLAIVAYRQPVTRGDIEQIRGVAVSTHTIKTLLEREWIRVVGVRDVPGKPVLYATTRQFLDYFGLSSLKALPVLTEDAVLEGFVDAEQQMTNDVPVCSETLDAVDDNTNSDVQNITTTQALDQQSIVVEE